MKRYLFFTTGDWEYNASLVRVRELGHELVQAGYEVGYVLELTPYNYSTLPQSLNPNCEKIFVPRGNGLKTLRERRSAIRSFSPDVVHVLNPSLKAFSGVYANLSAKLLADWDEWPPTKAGITLPVVLRKLGGWLENEIDRWFRRNSSIRIVCSRWLQQEFESMGFVSHYIPYAIYLKQKPEVSSPFTEPTLVYMGNLYPRFDVDILFEAAALLKERGISPPLKIIGGGGDASKWKEYCVSKGLENVEFLGFMTGDALWAHLNHASLLLFPMRPTIDNLGRCPSKTFAYAETGRPILTCHVGEIPETLGDAATYVEPSAKAFADAIQEFMGERTIEDKRLDYCLDRHTWQCRASSLIAAINGQSSPSC